jgi:site-specific recombinase XerD
MVNLSGLFGNCAIFIIWYPREHIKTPKLGRALPKDLSESDVDALLASPDTSTPLGMRDQAMFEVLYACGLRVSELIHLSLSEVNLNAVMSYVMRQSCSTFAT